MEPSNPNLAALLSETVWLKRLALHLTRDPASADDVVQETWAAALESTGSARIESPRAWLGQVARRVAGKLRRGSAHRKAREELGARDELDGSAPEDEVAARIELQRILGEELVRLPEPFRGVLFQQYYEGRAPQEIAAVTGTPAGTVRWRAKRGRELLREALVARDGRAWESWVVALAPVGGWVTPPITTSSAVGTALSMMTMKWVLAGLTTGVLVSLGWSAVEHSGARSPESPDHLAQVMTPAESAVPLTPVSATEGREVVPKIASEVGDGKVIARGRLRSSEDTALTNASVVFTNSEGVRHVAFVGEAAWGVVDLPPGAWTIEAAAEGHAALREDCVVSGEVEFHHDLVLAATGVIPIRLVDLQGDLFDPRSVSDIEFDWAWGVYASPIPQVSPIERSRRQGGEHAGGSWRTRVFSGDLPHLPSGYIGELALNIAPPLHVALTLGSEIIEQRRFDSVPEEWVVQLDIERIRNAMGGLRLQLVDPTTGRGPTGSERMIVEARSLTGQSQSIGFAVRQDVHENLLLPPGSYELTVGPRRRNGNHLKLQKRVEVERGRVLDLGELQLEPVEPVLVKITGIDALNFASLDAEPVESAMAGYEYQENYSFWEAESGAFAMRGVPPGKTHFTLELADDRRFRFENVLVSGGTLTLPLADAEELTEGEESQ